MNSIYSTLIQNEINNLKNVNKDILLEINKKIINSIIKYEDNDIIFKLKPLWVEIYCHFDKWQDKAIHGVNGFDEQKKNFLNLYFHRPPNPNPFLNGGRPGVDLILSTKKDMALAILLKVSVCFIEEKNNNKKELLLLPQKKLYIKLKEIFKGKELVCSKKINYDDSKRDKIHINIIEDKVENTHECARVGITNKGEWNDKVLTTFIYKNPPKVQDANKFYESFKKYYIKQFKKNKLNEFDLSKLK